MKLAKFIVKFRYVFLGLFLAFAVASVFFVGKTNINYDLKQYLPDDSDTNVSLGILEDEGFGYNCMMNVMLNGGSVSKAHQIATELEYKLNEDSAQNPRVAIITVSFDESGNHALLQIAINGDEFSENASYVVNKVPELLAGEDFAVSGGAVQNMQLTQAIDKELPIILGVSVAVVLVILLATSSSWIDPILFLIVVGIAALLNMGTNFIFGSISYITQSVAVVLQLALAMDYSIILLHNYNSKMEEGLEPKEALTKALSESFASIFSSCLTTVAGLAALLFMTFTIGFDIGMVLSKGVLLSMVSVFLLMPALILLFKKPIAKTQHKRLMIPTKRLSRFSFSLRKAITLTSAVVIAGCAVLSMGFNTYSFKVNLGSNEDSNQVADVFGNNNMFMVLFEKGSESENLAGHQEIVNFVYGYSDFKNEDGTNKGITAVYSPVVKYTEEELVGMLHIDSDMVEKLYMFMEKSGQAVSPVEIKQFAEQNITDGILNIKITPQKLSSMTDMDLSVMQIYYNMMDYDTEFDNNVPLIRLVTDLQDKIWRNTVKLLCETVLKVDPEPLFALADEIYTQREELAVLDVNAMIDGAMSMFESSNYCRTIFILDIEQADEKTFTFLASLEEMLDSGLFGERNTYMAGESPVLYDVEKAFDSDLTKTTVLTICCVILIIGLTFLSFSLPLLLVYIIQGAIWISMSFSAIFNSSIFFMSYIIVSCILMGATIDYGILLSSTYVKFRQKFGKKEALSEALKMAMPTVFTSGSIMTVAGFCVGLISSVEAINSVGLLLARGTIVSVIMVLVVLPALLVVFDKILDKTTKHKIPFVAEAQGEVQVQIGAQAEEHGETQIQSQEMQETPMHAQEEGQEEEQIQEQESIQTQAQDEQKEQN